MKTKYVALAIALLCATYLAHASDPVEGCAPVRDKRDIPRAKQTALINAASTDIRQRTGAGVGGREQAQGGAYTAQLSAIAMGRLRNMRIINEWMTDDEFPRYCVAVIFNDSQFGAPKISD